MMKLLVSVVFWACTSMPAFSFTYDAKDLPKDLAEAPDIVIAMKVAGKISYAKLTEEIESFLNEPIEWRENPIWDRLSKRNEGDSAFLVINSVRGELKVGEEFSFSDEWIPIELGSVKLYFLYRDGKKIYSNPCHVISITSHKKEIVSLLSDSKSLVAY